ncbi:MAG: hypothetical protein JWM80_1132 [Cyanobacteria bacterium RYN_339]|nr:hypothetical protein [Cyanobacteria bacterium RYN_339]
MRNRLAYRQLLVSCFGLGMAMGVVPGSASAAQPSKVGSVSYDQAHQALAIPVTGQEPKVQVRRLAPHQYVADLGNCVLARSEVQGQRMHGPLLAGWSLDETPTGQTVRLRLTLNQDVDPQIRFVRQGGVMLMTFGGRPVATVAAATTAAKRPVATVAAAVKRTTPVLPKVTTKSQLAFPTAAPVPVHLAEGHLRSDVPRYVGLQLNTATHAAPKPARTLVATHHAAAHQAVKPATKPPFPLMLAGRNLPFAVPAQAAAPVLPAPRIPAGLAMPGVVAPLASAPQFASLGSARYDAKRGVLVIPVSGELDPKRLEIVQLNKRWAYLDVPASIPNFSGVKFEERADKTFQRWVMAKRPNRNTTRLSFALGAAANFDVKLEGKELLVTVRPQGDLIAKQPKASAPVVAAKPAALVAVAPVVTAPIVSVPVAAPVAPIAAKPVVAPVAAKPVVAPVAAKPVVAVKPAPIAQLPVAKPAAKPTVVLAKAPVPVKAQAPAKPTTILDRPFFDQERHGLVVPYTGEIPLYRWSNQEDASVALEVKGAASVAGELEQSFKQHPVMKTWRVGPDAAAGTVQLAMTFRRPSEVVVAVDTARRQLLLIPQPRLTGEQVPTAAAPTTTLSAVKLPADGQRLYISFTGKVPAYTIETVSSQFAYINFEAAKLETKSVQFFAPDFHPSLNYWLLSERPLQGGVRLALALTQAGGPSVFEDRSNQRLVIELGGDDTQVGARSKPSFPAPWPGEHAPTGYQPADPLVKVSRKAS